MPAITGAIIVVGSRILVPVDIATTRAGFVMPVVGTVHFIGTIGTVQTVLEVGTIELVITTATVGTITSGKVTASVSSGVVDRVGTISEGKVTASVSSGVVDQARYVGTIGTVVEGKVTASVSSGIVDQARYIGTVGTILGGNVTASISSGVVDQVKHTGTVEMVGTIVDGKVTASVSSGVVDRVGTIDMVGVIGSITTSGTLPVSLMGAAIAQPVDIQFRRKAGLTLVSQTATVNGNTTDIDMESFSAAEAMFKVTAVSGTTPTLDLHLEGKFETTGDYKPIASQTGITATGTWFFTLNPLIFKLVRVRWVVGGTSPSFTFTAALQGMV